MSQVVEYVLTLRDQLSAGVTEANAHVNQLESSLGSVRSAMGSLTGMLGTLGVGFAIFKGAEFVHESVEAFHALEQVTAKVGANLESSAQKAGLNMSDITAMAKTLSSQVQFSRAEVMDMQSQLLTFPSITKDVFEQSMSMVTDIAKQVNHGLSETALMFGKAFSDPAKDLNKLIRYGVKFTETEKEKIISLGESGHLIEAQKSMLEAIAGSGYAGVAKAMFDADPLGRYNKTMGSVKMTVGELATDLLTKLAPALEMFANSVKSATDWIKANRSMLSALVKGVGLAWIAFKAGTLIIIPFTQGLAAVAPAAVAATTGLEAVGLAATLSLGPLTLLAAAIGTVVTGYSLLANMEERRQQAEVARMGGASEEANKFLDNQTVVYEKTMKHNEAVLAAKKYYTDELIKQHDRLETEINKTDGKGQDYSVLQSTINYVNKEMNVAHDYKGLIPVKNDKQKKEVAPSPTPATKAVGSKAVTINVVIKSLVNEMQIHTTNIKETGVKVREVIANILAEAVNDFQIVATNH